MLSDPAQFLGSSIWEHLRPLYALVWIRLLNIVANVISDLACRDETRNKCIHFLELFTEHPVYGLRKGSIDSEDGV